MAYYSSPEETRGMLAQITALILEVGRELEALSTELSAGVSAIVRKTLPNCYVTSNCSVEMVSAQMYEDFLLEHDVLLAENFHSFGIHHCGQTMEHMVAAYAKLGSRLAFAEVGAGSDIAAVRKALPDTFLNARYSPAALKTQSHTAIAHDVNALIENGRDEHGGNISLSCVGIDDATTDEAICAFLCACQKSKPDFNILSQTQTQSQNAIAFVFVFLGFRPIPPPFFGKKWRKTFHGED